ncbi:MAG: tRNA(Ile)-lysidine synthetase, partial [Candidatus Shikimatogenerans sp. JK-2022]|nr:tRNA(Ile)-lysidine synthetase [Candidatus Shikimatogenerans bostrichidophilus]
MRIKNKIIEFFKKKKILKKKFLIAVSGGIDSMVLLDILRYKLKNLYVINCFFNLSNSIKSNLLVLKYCLKNNIKFYFKSFNVLKYKKKKKISIQMAARKLRYKWMFNIF